MSCYCQAAESHPSLKRHHDTEHGFPVRSERRLFEYLLLEINQAGLSWLTVMKKRPAFKKAYAEFDVSKVARFDARERARLMADRGVVRNRLKIEAAIFNAQRLLDMRSSHGGFARWLDAHHPRDLKAWTSLFRDTFRFTGSTITREFLTGIGYLSGAHAETCPIYARLLPFQPPYLRSESG